MDVIWPIQLLCDNAASRSASDDWMTPHGFFELTKRDPTRRLDKNAGIKVGITASMTGPYSGPAQLPTTRPRGLSRREPIDRKQDDNFSRSSNDRSGILSRRLSHSAAILGTTAASIQTAKWLL